MHSFTESLKLCLKIVNLNYFCVNMCSLDLLKYEILTHFGCNTNALTVVKYTPECTYGYLGNTNLPGEDPRTPLPIRHTFKLGLAAAGALKNICEVIYIKYRGCSYVNNNFITSSHMFKCRGVTPNCHPISLFGVCIN